MQLEYNPDLVLTQEHTEAEVQNFTGSFCGFVLLREVAYDLGAFAERLKKVWGIAMLPSFAGLLRDEDTADGDWITDAPRDLMLDVPGAMVTVSFMEQPVPDGEAEYAAAHAVWPESMQAAKQHAAHLMIAVLPDHMSAMDAGMLYCRILSTALEDEHALAVYTSGTILEPKAFQQYTAQAVDALPMENLIFVGTYTREGGNCGYTVGMDSFGKDELEVLDCAESAEQIGHILRVCAQKMVMENTPAQWYITVDVDGQQWEGRRKDGVMVEGHSLQLQCKL